MVHIFLVTFNIFVYNKLFHDIMFKPIKVLHF